MGDRVTSLENTVEEIKGTSGVLVQQMQQLLQRSNSNNIPGALVIPPSAREESVEASTMNESRLARKKVKLPLFEGDDPVAWITHAEIYFDVQQTPDEMRVKLSRLSMEGPTIHWFNLLMETKDQLSWEKLKKALIVRY
ncbi:pentatricopeptide repeat-containing protein [Trifolium medium]|uniref:Pentatricopeptide repeat-containing protein n=1 Tax=Trifolium medium TaxID=97028 RepID=A0A392M863_9FABA|nr:pentatricopeptide repeat-containing protein [Trifolium medium]